jgi:ligand-binding sensor domain-containing protein/signal transduction histidine kinase
MRTPRGRGVGGSPLFLAKLPGYRFAAKKGTAPEVLIAAAVALFAGSVAVGETLPLHRLDVAEGLADSRVTAILQARRGDLWFATWDGVSRYDGTRFTNYGTKDGLPEGLVTSLAEDREGGLWFGTFSHGVAHLIDDPADRGPDPSTKFETFTVAPAAEASNVGALAVDAADRLWCSTNAGVYRADLRGPRPLRFEEIAPGHGAAWPQLLSLDARGRAWVGDGTAVVEFGDGPPVRHALPPDARGDMWNVTRARSGGFWVTTGGLLWRFVPRGDGVARDRWERMPIAMNGDNYIRVLEEDADGALWIGTFEGLVRWHEGRTTVYTTDQGLPDDKIRALHIDVDGNLWIGTHNGGAAKLPRGGLVNITTADGLPDRNVLVVVRSKDGRTYASTDRAGIVEIVRGRAVPVPGSKRFAFHNLGFNLVQGGDGDWWLGDDSGLYRFDGPELQFERGRKLDEGDGLPEPGLVMGLYRDRDGTLWVGQGTHWLLHVMPSRDRPMRIERVSLPVAGDSWLARRLLRARSGALWVSCFNSLGRLTGYDLASLAGSAGLPDSQTRWLLEDHLGRIWLAHRNRGVSMTENPGAEHPAFRRWTSRDGLSSDIAWTLAEDDAGRIYIGTSRGLDRLDPESGRIRHLGPLDGLAGAIVNSISRDDTGRLWVATSGGITILDPRREFVPSRAPTVYLSRVAVAGQDLALPESGARALGDLTLNWPHNALTFEWVAPSFDSGANARYAWRLDGADAAWSAPTDSRRVDYANLGPGRYVFRVRAVSPEGAAPEREAIVRFRILPPVWRRGWFVALAAVLAGAAVFGLYELRVRRLLAMERIRRQIATDLHDEMGSGLAQIAVLSEVAKRGASGDDRLALAEVARLARGLRESMSDIVWSVDPRKDRLADLLRRLHQVAHNLFAADGIAVAFDAPPDDALERVELAPDRRRQIYLAAKEALTNVARHAAATKVSVVLTLSSTRLTLTVVDDGRGFDPAAATEGRGLANLARRAAALSGVASVSSVTGHGTTVRLDIPLAGEIK